VEGETEVLGENLTHREDWQGKPKYSEKTCPSATLSTTNPTRLDPGLNPGRRGGKPATNRLSYGVALSVAVLRPHIFLTALLLNSLDVRSSARNRLNHCSVEGLHSGNFHDLHSGGVLNLDRDISCGFPQSFEASAGVLSRLDHDRFHQILSTSLFMNLPIQSV
jgi:hypothetical protein